ncbi:MAG: hypothetical protein LC754_17915 [Acidobacteria bacterium]|nr:hypothetical protein [Acidobacteriota bacterium]
MAKDETRRLASALLNADREAFDALQGIKGYAPSNDKHSAASIKALRDRMDELQRAETQALAAAATARDAATAGEWEFHNAMLGAKMQTTAQFGDNSDEVASLGLKKKSEYQRPKRRTGGGGSAPSK